MRKSGVDLALFFVVMAFFLTMSVFVSSYFVANDTIALKKASIPVFIFLKKSASKSDIIAIETELSDNIMVNKFKVITREMALENMIKKFSIDLSMFSENPFPYSIKVFLKPYFLTTQNLKTFRKTMLKNPAVESVEYPTNFLKNMNRIQGVFEVSGRLLITLLYIVEFVVMTSIIVILYSSKKKSYDTLKMLGLKRITLLGFFIKRTMIVSVASLILGTLLIIGVYSISSGYSRIMHIPAGVLSSSLTGGVIINILIGVTVTFVSALFTFLIKDEKV